jgi:hypothetical protein
MPPVTIAGYTFSSKGLAKKKYGQIRDGTEKTHDVAPEHIAFMVECVAAHPGDKIRGWLAEHDGYIERVYVGDGPKDKSQFGDKSIRVFMRSLLDPSVTSDESVGPGPCLDGLIGAKGCADAAAVRERYHKQKREERARDAVNDDVAAFREGQRREVDGLFECAECERAVAKKCVVVDHIDPLFEAILAEFLADHPECTLTPDDPLTTEWRAHHAAKWRAQLLCKGCHYVKTAGETSHRARKKREE